MTWVPPTWQPSPTVRAYQAVRMALAGEDEAFWWGGVALETIIRPLVVAAALATQPVPAALQVVAVGRDADFVPTALAGPEAGDVEPLPQLLGTAIPAPWKFHVDELTFTPDEDYTFLVLRIPRWAASFGVASLVAPAPPLDEDFWLPPPPWPLTTARAVTADDEIGQPLLLDEERWTALRGAPAVVPTAITADEDLPIAAAPVFGPDEDSWQNTVAPVAANVVWPAPWAWEQQEIVQPLGVEEDAWSRVVVWPATLSNAVLADDELPIPAAPVFTPDEDYTISVLRIPQWPASFGAIPVVSPVVAFEEDVWVPLVPGTVTYTLVGPWAYGVADDIVSVVDEDVWLPSLPWPLTTARPVTAEDEIELTLSVEDDQWQPPAPWPPTTSRPVTAEDEPPHGIAFDDDSVWLSLPPAPVLPLPPVQATRADDEIIQPPPPIQDEDAWQPPLPWPPTTARPFVADDEIVLPPPPIEDEDYWQNPVPPQLWPVKIPAAWPQEQDEQAFGLLPPLPPLPIPLLLGGGGYPSTRVWPFEGRTHYEDGRPVVEPAPEVAAPAPSPRAPVRRRVGKPAEPRSPTEVVFSVGPPLPSEVPDRALSAALREPPATTVLPAAPRPTVVLVTRHWGGLGLAMLMQRQGSAVVCAFDYTGVKAKELQATERCGDGLVEKLPLAQAMRQCKKQGALWVFDGNDLPQDAEQLRAAGELVIGTSRLSQQVEDDREFAAAQAEAVGFALPQTKKFTAYPPALAFLAAQRDRAYVYKPDKQDPTATYVPSAHDPAQANEELREYIKSLTPMGPISFILQEVVHGVEANFELWLRAGHPVAAFLDLESKRKLVGDLGENIGCAGGYVRELPLDSPGLKRTVGQYLQWAVLADYTGSVDVNVMVRDGQILFLENCFRFGYNAYPTIFQALATRPAEELLRTWVAGGTLEGAFRPGVGASLTLVCDHPKDGMPILVSPALQDQVYLYRAYQQNGHAAMVEDWPELACVTAHGRTLREAGDRCLALTDAVRFPGKGYRLDLTDDALDTLPIPRYRALQELGLVPRDPDDDDEEAITALLGVLE